MADFTILNDMKPRYLLKEHEIDKNLPSQNTIFEDQWDINEFRRQCKVVIVKNRVDEMEFDLIRIHPALVNAFRRIILREVPSMAIEKVHVLNNTSLLQDDVLAHRLGLIPLRADARLFQMKTDESEYSEENSLEFTLKIKCTFNKENNKDSSALAQDMYKNNIVTTKHIKWLPIGRQKDKFCEEDVGPIDLNPPILINKLRPGQEMDLKLVAVKGVGSDHAKFQPVATVYFRLLPEVKLLREVEGEAAERLQKSFSPGTIGIRKQHGKRVAFVENSRYEACSRNFYKHPDLHDAVLLSKVRDHHVFTIESLGALRPDEIFIRALRILRLKCLSALDELSQV